MAVLNDYVLLFLVIYSPGYISKFYVFVKIDRPVISESFICHTSSWVPFCHFNMLVSFLELNQDIYVALTF